MIDVDVEKTPNISLLEMKTSYYSHHICTRSHSQTRAPKDIAQIFSQTMQAFMQMWLANQMRMKTSGEKKCKNYHVKSVTATQHHASLYTHCLALR